MGIEVRFGTVRPVSFREFDESYKYTAQAKTGDAETWDCIYCGSQNNRSHFCTNCGRPGYTEWICPSCMYRNKGGGKCLSCGKPRLPDGFV